MSVFVTKSVIQFVPSFVLIMLAKTYKNNQQPISHSFKRKLDFASYERKLKYINSTI